MIPNPLFFDPKILPFSTKPFAYLLSMNSLYKTTFVVDISDQYAFPEKRVAKVRTGLSQIQEFRSKYFFKSSPGILFLPLLPTPFG